MSLEPTLDDAFRGWVDEVAALKRRCERLENALWEITRTGAMADLHPTMHEGNWSEDGSGYSVEFVYRYLATIDANIRQRARAALDGDHE